MKFFHRLICITFINLLISAAALSQEKKGSLEINGFIMLDAGYNFNSIDPNWFDVMRPTKLPSRKNEFGSTGNVYFSMRQTRLSFRSKTPTHYGELKTTIDIDMFGFGDDAGQTTFHLMTAYAEWRRILVGQTASVFMDTDIVPITLDYWGPCSRTFNFNIQFRYTLIRNEHNRLNVALDRPNAKADGGAYRPQLDLENVSPQFPVPNLAAHYRRITSWGHVQAGGLLKLMKWKDLTGANPYDLTGHDLGWGVNVSTRINSGDFLTIKAQAIYGEGVQNYFADSTPDVGLQSNEQDPSKPVKGMALPTYGIFVFTEWKLSQRLSSTIGYGSQAVDNSDLQDASAFHKGYYAIANLRYYPVERVMAGIEYQFGRRENNGDNFSSVGNKIQLSFKMNFSSGELSN